MANWRRVFTGAGVGVAVGMAIILVLDGEIREKLRKELLGQWESLRFKIQEYQQRLEEAVEEGKAASRMRQQELEKEMSIKRIEEESPDYIV